MGQVKKPLKLWNGRWKRGEHVYVAAYSVADAIRLANQASDMTPGWWNVTYTEVSKYWHKGTWGNSMNGIVPERGVWVQKGWDGKPERLV